MQNMASRRNEAEDVTENADKYRDFEEMMCVDEVTAMKLATSLRWFSVYAKTKAKLC